VNNTYPFLSSAVSDQSHMYCTEDSTVIHYYNWYCIWLTHCLILTFAPWIW